MTSFLKRGARPGAALRLCALLLCLATPAMPQTPDPWTQAQDLVRAGRLDQAASILERLVAEAPSDTRARVELAAVLLRLGQGTRARYHFGLARGGHLPPQVRATVDGLLAGLPLRSGWEGGLSFSVSPESNPARGSTGFLLVNGQPIEVGARGAGRSGYAASASARAARVTPLSSQTALLGGASVRAVARSGQLADETTLTAFGGIRLIRGATRTEATVQWSERFIDSKSLASGPGLSLSHLRPLGTRGTLAANLTTETLRYGGLPGLDGVQTGAAVTYGHALSPQTSLQAGLSWFRRDAAQAASSYTSVRQTLGASHLFRGGLRIAVTAGYTRSWRDAPSGFFTIIREDKRRDISLRVSHARLSMRGFAPTLELGREVQDSTIPLERFQNNRLSLGLTRSF